MVGSAAVLQIPRGQPPPATTPAFLSDAVVVRQRQLCSDRQEPTRRTRRCYQMLASSTPGRSNRSSSLNSCRAITRFRYRRTSWRFSLGPSPGGVGAGFWIVAQSCQQNGVEGAVELPITRAVQPIPGHLPRGRRDGVDASQGGEGRL